MREEILCPANLPEALTLESILAERCVHHWEGPWITPNMGQAQWLARDNPETNLIAIKPETASHLASGVATALYPTALFPVKSLALSAHVSSMGNSFPNVRQEPTLWPWKECPFLQYAYSTELSSPSHGTKPPSSCPAGDLLPARLLPWAQLPSILLLTLPSPASQILATLLSQLELQWCHGREWLEEKEVTGIDFKKKKKMHCLKLENCVWFGRLFEDSSPCKAAFHILLDCSQQVREDLGYRGKQEFLQQRPSSQTIKRLLWIKENQISQVNEFSPFLWLGRCKNLGSLKSFHWYAPWPSRGSVPLCAILSPFGVHRWGWLQGLRVRWQACCWFPSWVPSGSLSGQWSWLMAMTSFVYGKATFFIHTRISTRTTPSRSRWDN